MHGVVPLEERLAVRARIGDGAESIRKFRAVLQGLELGLGEWIVVGDVRTTMGLGDIEIHEQFGHEFGSHAGPAIGVQGELSWGDIVLGNGLRDELLRQLGALALCDHPTHDIAAEDIQDDVEMEVGPLLGTA